VGATGNVGREILAALAEREFPCDEVVALASSRSIGRQVSFGEDDILDVQVLDSFDFKGTDIVLSSPGAKVSAEFAPRAAKAGAVVIDNTSQWRMDADVPLVVPEVNPQAIKGYEKKGIIANPNCSTIQMVMALKPLHDLAKIKRVVVATYQSVSGAGRRRWTSCSARPARSTSTTRSSRRSADQADRVQRHSPYRRVHGGRVDQGGMEDGGRDPQDPRPRHRGVATCVRVPVFIGHAEAVNVEFERPITVEEARGAARLCRDQRRRSSRRRGLRDPGRDRRRGRSSMSAASARTRRSRTGSPCGWSPTICARARRPTRCRSPNA
jgi:aspartate-semialdehyde dehydrogenase